MDRPFIEATLTFIPSGEDGRSQLNMTLNGLVYRPHIVVGNPAQREAIVGQGNVLLETYHGVAFAKGPEHIEPNVPCHVQMMLLYWPAVNYDSVVPGATFTLREGGRIVAFGEVTKRWVESAPTIA
ncbi:hypothetical protein [Ralstonia solanacearum]|uniref:Uncharacterized protein n=1 Tax=Ralstonia solanacearum TaxID=305 RepID=A0AAE3T2E2_RALSL|nr:hypothetical protein [Ralstonia solanacearum]MDB0520961.1 hypothetical protein [Ralstonia solanacearum]